MKPRSLACWRTSHPGPRILNVHDVAAAVLLMAPGPFCVLPSTLQDAPPHHPPSGCGWRLPPVVCSKLSAPSGSLPGEYKKQGSALRISQLAIARRPLKYQSAAARSSFLCSNWPTSTLSSAHHAARHVILLVGWRTGSTCRVVPYVGRHRSAKHTPWSTLPPPAPAPALTSLCRRTAAADGFVLPGR